MSLIPTQSSKRHKAIEAVRQKTPERYLPKLLSKEEHVLPEGHPLSVLFDETLMRKMASPLKDSVLRTSLGAANAGGCDRVHPSPPERCPQGSEAVLLKIEQNQLRVSALHS